MEGQEYEAIMIVFSINFLGMKLGYQFSFFQLKKSLKQCVIISVGQALQNKLTGFGHFSLT